MFCRHLLHRCVATHHAPRVRVAAAFLGTVLGTLLFRCHHLGFQAAPGSRVNRERATHPAPVVRELVPVLKRGGALGIFCPRFGRRREQPRSRVRGGERARGEEGGRDQHREPTRGSPRSARDDAEATRTRHRGRWTMSQQIRGSTGPENSNLKIAKKKKHSGAETPSLPRGITRDATRRTPQERCAYRCSSVASRVLVRSLDTLEFWCVIRQGLFSQNEPGKRNRRPIPGCRSRDVRRTIFRVEG